MENYDHFHGLGNKTYMLIQSYECFNWYISSQDKSIDVFDPNVAYISYVSTKKNENFQEKVKDRHNVLKAFCSIQNLDLQQISDASVVKELTYILNNTALTEENINEYCNEEEKILALFQTYSPQEKQIFYQYACPLLGKLYNKEDTNPADDFLTNSVIEDIVKAKIHAYRPIYHQIKESSQSKEYPKNIPFTSIKQDSIFKKDLEKLLIA